ncbi:MAG: hypothetical protein QHJ81_09915 [Anaerolineae bacterium]|nr:hypothetical protein [Anaerolineae bacterium]
MQRGSKPHGLVAVEPGWAREYEALLEAYSQAGGDPAMLKAPNAATLVVSANRVLAANEVPGVHFQAEALPDGVRARIAVEPGVRIERPVHLCFGMLPAEGVQRIEADYEIGAGAQVEFIAHCTFPNAIRLQHIMDARIHVGPDATMQYRESHYHGPHGGIEVLPKARVTVEEAPPSDRTGHCRRRGRPGTGLWPGRHILQSAICDRGCGGLRSPFLLSASSNNKGD